VYDDFGGFSAIFFFFTFFFFFAIIAIAAAGTEKQSLSENFSILGRSNRNCALF
jgi:hypothetical protein